MMVVPHGQFLEKMYGRPVNVPAEVLLLRRAEEKKKVSPKSKKQSNKGATYLETELTAVVESSSPEDVCAAVAFVDVDGGVTMGGICGLEVNCDVNFVEVKDNRCTVIVDDCNFVGGAIFKILDEDPDFEGVWSCDGLLNCKVVPANGEVNNNNIPFFYNSSFPCPFSVSEIDCPAMVVAN